MTKTHGKYQKIYFDCTLTFHSGLNTGIQRVVRNLLRESVALESNLNINCHPVINVMGRFYEIPVSMVMGRPPLTAQIGGLAKGSFARLRSGLQFFDKSNGIQIGINLFLDFLEFILKRLFSAIKIGRIFFSIYKIGARKVCFDSGTTLVLLDAFWTFNLYKSIRKIKLSGARVVTVIYDLIPINYSQYSDSATTKFFKISLPSIIEYSDSFMCISKTVADDLKKYFELSNFSVLSEKVFYFHLGADFNRKVSQVSDNQLIAKEQDETLNSLFSNSVWLSIGTIEPRKNHRYILDAFDQLWKEGGEDNLYIVGRIGWKCEEILERIKNHPLLDKKLFFRSDVTDSELALLYGRSKGLIFASFVEGFGLPLVEAMASGIFVLCSNIPIFREVGGDYPGYFDLQDSQSLVVLLQQSKYSHAPPPRTWISWRESGREFMEILIGKP